MRLMSSMWSFRIYLFRRGWDKSNSYKDQVLFTRGNEKLLICTTRDEKWKTYVDHIYYNDKFYKVGDEINFKPAKIVLPFSIHSTNHEIMVGFSSLMKKMNWRITDPDIIPKLKTRKNYKDLLELIEESYPEVNSLAELSMLLRIKSLSRSFTSVQQYPYTYCYGGGRDTTARNEELKVIYNTPGTDRLHRRMKYYDLTWDSAWRMLRALCIYLGVPKIRRYQVILPAHAKELKFTGSGQCCDENGKLTTVRERLNKIHSRNKITEKKIDNQSLNSDEPKSISNMLTTHIGDFNEFAKIEGIDHIYIHPTNGLLIQVSSNRVLEEINKKLDSMNLSIKYRIYDSYSKDDFNGSLKLI